MKQWTSGKNKHPSQLCIFQHTNFCTNEDKQQRDLKLIYEFAYSSVTSTSLVFDSKNVNFQIMCDCWYQAKIAKMKRVGDSVSERRARSSSQQFCYCMISTLSNSEQERQFHNWLRSLGMLNVAKSQCATSSTGDQLKLNRRRTVRDREMF